MKYMFKIILAVFTFSIFIYQSNASYANFPALKRGKIICGVDQDAFPKELFEQHKQSFQGFSEDVCKAYSMALFQSDSQYEVRFLSGDSKAIALEKEEVDLLLFSNVSRINTEKAYEKFVYSTNLYFQNSLIALHRDLDINKYSDLNNRAVCLMDKEDTLNNLRLLESKQKIKLNAVVYKDLKKLRSDFLARKCDIFAGDGFEYLYLTLYETDAAPGAKRSTIKPISPDLSMEPLGIVIKADNDQFFDLTKWVILGLIEAEEKNISNSNILSIRYSEDPSIQRLLGNTKGVGVVLNLPDRWLYNVLKTVGNYGDIFDRNLGKNSDLKIERGLNNLWTKDGLIYAIPVR